MDSNAVVERHNPQDPAIEFRHCAPESLPIPVLALHADGILNDLDAPLFPEIRALPEDFPVEILGKPIPVASHCATVRSGEREASSNARETAPNNCSWETAQISGFSGRIQR